MNEESFRNEDELNVILDKISKEELAQVIKELMIHSEELEGASKILTTHLKALCYKNGETLF